MVGVFAVTDQYRSVLRGLVADRPSELMVSDRWLRRLHVFNLVVLTVSIMCLLVVWYRLNESLNRTTRNIDETTRAIRDRDRQLLEFVRQTTRAHEERERLMERLYALEQERRP